jgi:HK97 gp10 family phage protein
MSLKWWFRSKNSQVMELLGKEAEIAITKACMMIDKEVKRLTVGARTGKIYKVPGTKRRKYVASAPGEAPAVRLGDLRKRYTWLTKGRGLKMKGYIGNPLKYAIFLEYGTSRMAKRPHFVRAMENKKERIFNLFRKLV